MLSDLDGSSRRHCTALMYALRSFLLKYSLCEVSKRKIRFVEDLPVPPFSCGGQGATIWSPFRDTIALFKRLVSMLLQFGKGLNRVHGWVYVDVRNRGRVYGDGSCKACCQLKRDQSLKKSHGNIEAFVLREVG